LATGGFGADFSTDGYLAKFRPDLLHLPTTNGDHCTGDGIKMGEAIGAKTIDLEWVQVHPTGLVKPDEPDAKIKFLAAEALRGVGGLVLDANGHRFANELGRRDYVTGEMWKSKPPFRLCLNKAAADEIIWHAKHYTGRGVMKFYESGNDLAKDMGIPVQTLVDTHQAHYLASEKTAKDPDGGSWPAYPSGKSWDEASGKTGSGKKFYHNVIPGSKVPTEPFYVAIITPVIHYCMGGLQIDTDSLVLGQNGPIAGLYAAGEIAGGVHGNNRLGGNSLLDCVVFGRVSGAHAAKYILGDDVTKVDLKALKALPVKSGGPGADAKKAEGQSAPAASAPAAPARVKPGWEQSYNREAWESKRHPRKKFVRLYEKYVAWKNGPSLSEKFETRMGWDKDVEVGPPLIEYQERPSNLINMHYFPLPDETGANALIPGFHQKKDTHVIVWEFISGCWGGIDKSTKSKMAFVFAIFMSIIISSLIIWEMPGEKWCILGLICH
jgi:succinate dehydrogenase/fumarate reductase flavoprotein subunit